MAIFGGARPPLDTEMTGRTCLVTGATDGHGRAVAKLLAARGAEVIVHARSEEKARRVCEEIAAETGKKPPEILLADLSRAEEIDAAIDQYRASGRPLHVLVNNAGLVGLDRRTNDAGQELTFAVNYLALFRLTMGLLPLLRSTGPTRVVNISSDTYKIAKLDFDNLMLERGYNMAKAYGQSKLAILYFTLELGRRLEGSGVTVNAVDPGPVASNIGADNPGLAYRLLGPMIRHLFPSAERAARTALWVATDPELEKATAGYYRSLAHREKPLDFNPDTSARLWQASLDLNGFEEDPLR